MSIKGHSESHPVKMVLKDCWEYEYKSDQALDGGPMRKHRKWV